jgi:hypothetical protein
MVEVEVEGMLVEVWVRRRQAGEDKGWVMRIE